MSYPYHPGHLPPRVSSAPMLPPRPNTTVGAPPLPPRVDIPPAYSPVPPPPRPASTVDPGEVFPLHHYNAPHVSVQMHQLNQPYYTPQQLPPRRDSAEFPGPSLVHPSPHSSHRPYLQSNLTTPAASLSPPPVHSMGSRSPDLSPLDTRSRDARPPDTYPLRDVDELHAVLRSVDTMADSQKLSFAQDTLRLLDRHLRPPAHDVGGGPNPPPAVPRKLKELAEASVAIVISFTTHEDPAIRPLALYLRGHLQADGDCPEFLPRDPRQAFADFKAAARAGEPRGWYRLGRDYETVGDLARAHDCFSRGATKGSCECAYRLGMANLLGQLNMRIDPSIALPLLASAADSASIDLPLPAYVYGMLLAGELETPQPIPTHLVHPPSAPPELLQPQQARALRALSTAAYLHHAPAQYKMGFLYEHAGLGCPYDPLMSVQWYSLGSQGGDMEADMGLTKWFLCGAEGCFPKNEDLARTFAEKAARKGHANGCFAMGYYFEVGIGGRKDMEQARKWYSRAARLNSQDAITRLRALDGPAPQALSAAEHETKLQDTLVRRHTTAKNRSDRLFAGRPARTSTAGPSPGLQAPLQVAHQDRRASAGTDHTSYYLNPAGGDQAPSRDPRRNSFPGRTPMDGFLSPHMTASPMSHYPPDPRQVMSPSLQMQSPAMPYPATSTSRRASDLPPTRGPGLRRPSQSPLPGAYPGSPRPEPVQLADGIRRFSLQDTPVDPASQAQALPRVKSPDELEAEREAKREQERLSGPQTFAEMGLVSKPVEDEGCRVM